MPPIPNLQREYTKRWLGWREVSLALKKRSSIRIVLHGSINKCWVEVESTRSPRGYIWDVRVKHSAIPDDLGFCKADLASSLKRWVGAGDFEIGDPEFDAQIETAGIPSTLAAVLTPDTRSALLEWIERGALVREGQIQWQVEAGKKGRQVDREIKPLTKLAWRLRHSASTLRQRLVRNILAEDLGAVRCVNLAQLLRPKVGATGAQLKKIIEVLSEARDADCTEHIRDALLCLSNSDPQRFSSVPVERLLDMLDGQAPHQLASLAELGRRGHTSALPAVVALSAGLFVSSAVKSAARQAAGDIIKRTGGGAGALMVVDGEEGGMTLT